MFLLIIEVLFWISLGLHFLGVSFRYQNVIIGICAILIGILKLAGLL